jgi:hypothetical protein
MANTNPQAVFVANNKIRPVADRFGQLYNVCRSLQAEATADNWTALFAGGSGNTIVDGSETDGRTPITDADVIAMSNLIISYVSFMEASANANRNLVLKIAVNPERV